MKGLLGSFILLAVTLSGVGCQCCPLTDCYANHIDDISDHPECWDRLYHPCFDVSRIGMADWCDCKMNRLWCWRGCCNSCQACGESCDDQCEADCVVPSANEQIDFQTGSDSSDGEN